MNTGAGDMQCINIVLLQSLAQIADMNVHASN
jgi:hypothetical protein